MKLPQIPQDKANHFIYGFLLYIFFNHYLNPYISLVGVSIFALGKELYDYYKYKSFSILDFVFTIIPSLLFILKDFINN